MEISRHLRQAMAAAGKTQKGVPGVTQATVSRIVGGSSPRYSTLRKLCHALPAFADAVIADLTKKSAARTSARHSQDRGKDTI